MRMFLVLLTTFLLCACRTGSSEIKSDELSAGVRVKVVMTVDWEGMSLESSNIRAMQQLRADYPTLPLVHYLNAAYFTKPGARPEPVIANVRSTLRPIDQLGLHIHAWKTLVEAAGVEYRNQPSLRPGGVGYSEAECRYDCGHVIPLIAYTSDEMSRVVHFSLDTLERHGFGRARHFRAGAWMVDPSVARALVSNGILTDSSSVPAKFLEADWGDTPLYPTVARLWPNSRPTTQPYVITTDSGSLLEVPDNGCLADYMTGQQMMAVVRDNIRLAVADDKTRTVVVGFHQETATDYLPRIRDFLRTLKAEYGNTGEVAFTVMPNGNL